MTPTLDKGVNHPVALPRGIVTETGDSVRTMQARREITGSRSKMSRAVAKRAEPAAKPRSRGSDATGRAAGFRPELPGSLDFGIKPAAHLLSTGYRLANK